METLAPSWTYRHLRIRIATRQQTAFVDVTDRVAALVAAARIRVGFVIVEDARVDIIDRTLMLEPRERLFLLELNGPRERAMSVTVIGEAGQ